MIGRPCVDEKGPTLENSNGCEDLSGNVGQIHSDPPHGSSGGVFACVRKWGAVGITLGVHKPDCFKRGNKNGLDDVNRHGVAYLFPHFRIGHHLFQ